LRLFAALFVALSAALLPSTLFPELAQASCVNTAQSIAAAATAPTLLNETSTVTSVDGTTATSTPVVVQDTCGGDDVSYQVSLPTTITFQGTEYNAVYATTNSTLVFGHQDNTYWDFPNTTSISVNSYDWVVLSTENTPGYPTSWQSTDEHLIITSSQAGFQVDLAVRPYGANVSNTPLSTIVVTAAINSDNTLSITYLSDVQQGLNTRTGVRLPDGRVVSLQEAGLTRVYVAPVVTSQEISPAPTESPSASPTPTPTPSSSPTPTPTPTPTPSPTPTVEPTPSPTPSETATSTPTPSPSPTPSQSTSPLPSPSENPSPTPTPSPSPVIPTPTPEPVVPAPEPVTPPRQDPIVAPEPPAPAPEPAPEPIPAPAPEPDPVPQTQPTVPAEEPAPPSPVEETPAPPAEPDPAPAADPTQEPAPEPDPAPAVDETPNPEPAPAPEESIPADNPPVPEDPQPAPAPDTNPTTDSPEPPPLIVISNSTTAETWVPAVDPETYMTKEDIKSYEEIGIVPNNADQLPTDVPKPAPAEALVAHVQIDVPGVENGGIQFFGTQSQPQVVGEDGNLTTPPPPPGSGLPIPPDAITLTDTFIGQPGGTTFTAPDVAVPVIETPVEGALAVVPGVQALNHAFVAMSNIGNDMSPITRKKAKKILVLTTVIAAVRRRFN